MLSTLGFRIPAKHLDSLLGQVAVYPWDARFADAWKNLPARKRTEAGRPTKPSYRQFLTGLTAVHNRPVRILEEWKLSEKEKAGGAKGLIVTSEPIKSFHLTTCMRAFETLQRGGEDLNTLTPLLPTADLSRRFADYVTAAECGTAEAPRWVFDSATWAVMARLGRRSLRLEDNGPSLPLRMDTDASLLAWDDPIGNTWDGWTGHAMLRIQARIITQPGVSDLAIVFDAHLTRINDQWRGAKNAWIARDDPSQPILRVPVRNLRPAEEG